MLNFNYLPDNLFCRSQTLDRLLLFIKAIRIEKAVIDKIMSSCLYTQNRINPDVMSAYSYNSRFLYFLHKITGTCIM